MSIDFLYLTAGIGYKFLPSRAAEFSLNVFDVLGRNSSIRREVNQAYVQNIQTNLVTRYIMLSFAYTFSKKESESK